MNTPRSIEKILVKPPSSTHPCQEDGRLHGDAPRCTPKGLKRGWGMILALATATLLSAPLLEAAARPGGGHRFSGGSRRSYSRSRSRSSSSGSYSGGYRRSSSGGFLGIGGGCGMSSWMEYLLILLAIAVVGGFSIVPKLLGDEDVWDSGGNTGWGQTPLPPPRPPRPDLSVLRTLDPNFSPVVLEDFLYNLYVRAMEARGTGGDSSTPNLDTLAPYLSKSVRAQLASRGGRPVHDITGVIVGAQRVTNLSGLEEDTVTLGVLFETNYTELYAPPPGQDPPPPMTFYTRERWNLSRAKTAKSRRPDEVHTFNCPNCGAPVEGSQDEKCEYCGSFFNSGEFDWFVQGVTLLSEEPRGPLLTGPVEERGTNLPTVHHPQRNEEIQQIQGRDPSFDLDALVKRVELIFEEMNTAWTQLQWERARPFVSDRFYMAQTYWIDAYKKQGLRNVLKEYRITRTELAKATTDPFFDSITLRVYATSIDTTVHDATGRVVSGNPNVHRAYSEYWTLIRAHEAKGRPSAEKSCPACGAPLDVNASGNCEHCGSKVAGGGYDWVLSRVEQDDVYAG